MGNDGVNLRDYSLVGVETQKAIEMGLADAEWYQSPVPREKMRDLLVRKDWPAIRDLLLWFGLIIGSGYLFFVLWGSWWAVLPYVVYSTLYASTSDSRWHESSHGTAFKSDWLNILLYEISSFMVFRQSTVWRWSHARHHSDTIIRGRDPEIAVKRPPKFTQIFLGFIGLRGAIPELRRLFLHASGKIDPEVATYVPESDYRIVYTKARIYLLIYATVITLSIVYQTILPLMFIGLPTILGGWLMPIYGYTQHAGLQENVLDHRLNSRTVYMNRVHRFLYWNMNYHVEHHMFPLVPYHALPKLHEYIKDDCPPAKKSIWDAFMEIIPAVLKQRKDPTYFLDKELPKGAGTLEERKKRTDGIISPKVNGNRLNICKVEDLPHGEVKRFDFEEKTFAVYHTESGTFYVTDGICTHGNAHLGEGVVIGEVIECAKHNGRFNLSDGSPRRMPVCVGIKTYPVEVVDDVITLELEKVRQVDEVAQTFKVVSNRNVATFIKELVLEPVDGKLDYQPGQYIHLNIPPHKTKFSSFTIDDQYKAKWESAGLFDSWAENTIRSNRNYSLATNPATDQTLKFNIRIFPSPDPAEITAGTGSSYVFSLKEGDVVKLTGPFGYFLIKDTDREMIYLGGGAGMAPIRSHLATLFETKKTQRKVSYWYGARSLSELFYDDYFRAIEKDNPNFSFHVALSEPEKEDEWKGNTGFIHECLLKEYLAKHPDPTQVEYYLCGPPAMVQSSISMLHQLGVKDELIAFDEF